MILTSQDSWESAELILGQLKLCWIQTRLWCCRLLESYSQIAQTFCGYHSCPHGLKELWIRHTVTQPHYALSIFCPRLLALLVPGHSQDSRCLGRAFCWQFFHASQRMGLCQHQGSCNGTRGLCSCQAHCSGHMSDVGVHCFITNIV